jgi:UDP-N-acetylmuramoylalanine--D-glutamate ligase
LAVTRWQGKRVVILGGARQGTALARYLAGKQARVVISDLRSPADLQPAIQALDTLPVEWVFGDHPLSLLDDADLVCPSGGVPLDIPFIEEARRRNIPLSNDTQLFLEAAPCTVIGITGSAGKTTTTTLAGRIASAAANQPGSWLSGHKVWVGGNIGNPLLGELSLMTEHDLVILELSSFQLELVTRSPQVAAVLNITPNHLDRHGTMQAYTAAKQRIIQFQGPDGIVVLGRDDPGAWNLRDLVQGKLYSFGSNPPAPGSRGTFLAEHMVMLQEAEKTESLLDTSRVRLRGAHNLQNVLAAAAITCACGLPAESIAEGIQDFTGVAHRLEFVREWGGAKWYNDSIATAPERVIAALHSFDEPLVLLAGGRDKKLPWSDFARVVSQRVDHLILFGEAAGLIYKAIDATARRPFSITRCAGLREAVIAASQVISEGDIVLLSPGGTSFDEFEDFEERGERYREWVNNLL